MDIKEYIQSGIIEQYVLGLASAEEAAELQQLRMQFPELNEAILNFEKAFEENIFASEMQPPAFIKSSLEKQLFGEDHLTAASEIASKPEPEKQSASVYNIRLWRYIAAACIILLIVSTALNFYFYSGYKNSQNQYQALLTERNTLQANNTSYRESLQLLQDTSMLKIEMKALPGKGENIAVVLWSKESKDVYIYANGMQQTPQGKQYQLWAIVDGKPVSAGVIGDCIGLCKMTKIDHAQAFAITLEKEGGSEAPTLSEMYVMGKI